MGSTAEDVSAECKQQHGEKIIEKSLPGRMRDWERSAPSAAFCRAVRRNAGIWQLNPWHGGAAAAGNSSELGAESGTFCTWHCMDQQGGRANKELKSAKPGETEAQGSR